MKTWTTACPDWRERIVAGRSLVPCKPLFPTEAKKAMEAFKALRIVDAPGEPTIEESCRPWVLDFAEAIFGAYDAKAGRRLIREFFLLVSKKNSKSTIAAAIMLTALIRNWRRSAEFLIVAPTIEVAQNSFKPAFDMVRADPELVDLLHCSEHHRTITHRKTGAVLKVVAADKDTVTGKKATGVLIDELWLFGKRPNADAMLREVTGGLVSRPEGFVIYLSTQSDEPPAGVFKSRLAYFRDVRDGEVKDPKSLGVLYEFPEAMIEAEEHLDPANYRIVNPNIGLSVDQEWLEDEYRKAELAGQGQLTVHCSKHLNLEVGLSLRNDAWAGARHWLNAAEPGLTLAELIRRSDVAVVGGDGGGLDDLLGMAVIGRCRTTKRWLLWTHAWCQPEVLDLRKDIASKLRDLEAAGDLTICEHPTQDVEEFVDIVERLKDAGLLPEKEAIGLDPAGVAAIIDALVDRGVTDEQLMGVPQGYRLNGAVLGTERKVGDGTFRHGGQALMTWCVGNAKTERRGNAVLITKQVSGVAKIDPLIATFNAFALMTRNPEGQGRSFWEAPEVAAA